MYIHMHFYLYICVHMYTYTCIYVHIYKHTDICIYTFIHIHYHSAGAEAALRNIICSIHQIYNRDPLVCRISIVPFDYCVFVFFFLYFSTLYRTSFFFLICGTKSTVAMRLCAASPLYLLIFNFCILQFFMHLIRHFLTRLCAAFPLYLLILLLYFSIVYCAVYLSFFLPSCGVHLPHKNVAEECTIGCHEKKKSSFVFFI